jgi:hypothetical protein
MHAVDEALTTVEFKVGSGIKLGGADAAKLISRGHRHSTHARSTSR